MARVRYIKDRADIVQHPPRLTLAHHHANIGLVEMEGDESGHVLPE